MIDKKTYNVSDGVEFNAELKAFMINIEPMYVGIKAKDRRLETVVTLKVYDSTKDVYKEYQAIVPPKSRLDEEVKKLLKLKDEKTK